MTTLHCRQLLLATTLALTGAAFAADLPTESGPSAAEPPYVGDTIELTAEQRAERSLRTIQVAMERVRSNRAEDEELIVCLKQTPTGSHRPVINCATNRFWGAIRENSLGGFLGYAGGNAGSARKDDKVFTISVDDYNKLEKRFGKLPKEFEDKI